MWLLYERGAEALRAHTGRISRVSVSEFLRVGALALAKDLNVDIAVPPPLPAQATASAAAPAPAPTNSVRPVVRRRRPGAPAVTLPTSGVE